MLSVFQYNLFFFSYCAISYCANDVTRQQHVGHVARMSVSGYIGKQLEHW